MRNGKNNQLQGKVRLLNNSLASYLKVIEINPNNGKAYYYAAGLLRSKGDSVKANEFMNKAVALRYGGR